MPGLPFFALVCPGMSDSIRRVMPASPKRLMGRKYDPLSTVRLIVRTERLRRRLPDVTVIRSDDGRSDDVKPAVTVSDRRRSVE